MPEALHAAASYGKLHSTMLDYATKTSDDLRSHAVEVTHSDSAFACHVHRRRCCFCFGHTLANLLFEFAWSEMRACPLVVPNFRKEVLVSVAVKHETRAAVVYFRLRKCSQEQAVTGVPISE